MPSIQSGLIATLIVVVSWSLLRFVDRWLDVRNNRRALRRRQIARHAPRNESAPAAWPATDARDLGRANYARSSNVPRPPDARQPR